MLVLAVGLFEWKSKFQTQFLLNCSEDVGVSILQGITLHLLSCWTFLHILLLKSMVDFLTKRSSLSCSPKNCKVIVELNKYITIKSFFTKKKISLILTSLVMSPNQSCCAWLGMVNTRSELCHVFRHHFQNS